MPNVPIGIILLIVVSILVYFGIAHRVLDRLRISDKTALVILGAMIIGSFIDIPIPIPGRVASSINVGGGLIPIGLAIYLLAKAGSTKEWVRALVATVVAGGSIYFISSILLGGNPGGGLFENLDSVYIYPIVAGIIAYVVGRSRRAAFIAATLGVLLLDVANYIYLLNRGLPGRVIIGGAGAFDSIVLAGIVAVLLAEVIGETRERLQGGPAKKGRPKELLKSLENAEYASSLGVSSESSSSEEQEEKEKGDTNERNQE